MAIRVAIADDDAVSAKRTAELIRDYAKKCGEVFKIVFFSDGDDISSDYRPIFDIIFLNVHMKRMDGVAAAEFIRKMDDDVMLIFVADSPKFAVQGYKVAALDYLIKPLTRAAIFQVLGRCIEKLPKNSTDCLLLPIDNGIVKMNISRILFIESFKHKMLVITKDGTFTLSCTMRNLEEKLANKGFFRCNNGYLVNLDYVNKISGNFVCVENYDLIISRPRRKAFLEAVEKYMLKMT